MRPAKPTIVEKLFKPAKFAAIPKDKNTKLAEMADLRVVRLDNVFFVTTPERVKALQDAWEKHGKKGRALEAPPPGPEPLD